MLIVMAPRIEFRLHRTRSVYFTVQNRYLEQVVVVTGTLSARPFSDSRQGEKKKRQLTPSCYAPFSLRSITGEGAMLHVEARQ
jgi:hypothetical protein